MICTLLFVAWAAIQLALVLVFLVHCSAELRAIERELAEREFKIASRLRLPVIERCGSCGFVAPSSGGWSCDHPESIAKTGGPQGGHVDPELEPPPGCPLSHTQSDPGAFGRPRPWPAPPLPSPPPPTPVNAEPRRECTRCHIDLPESWFGREVLCTTCRTSEGAAP